MNADDIDEFHRVPRMSGSGAPRLFACASSFAREHETHEFRKEHGISGPDGSVAAKDGTLIHMVLAAVPYANSAFGIGGPQIPAPKAVEEACDKCGIDLDREEFWFCVKAIKKRDKLITMTIAEAIEKTGGTRSIDISLDQHRMKLDDSDRFTAVGDVVAIVENANGIKTAAILDYKSGWGSSAAEVSRNRQLLSQAVLVKGENPAVDLVRAALVDRDTINDPLAVVRFESGDLERARQKLMERIELAERLKAAWFGESADFEGKDEDEKQAALSRNSQTGNHCQYCNGMISCVKLREEMKEFVEQLETSQPLLLQSGSTEDMNIENFTAALGQTAALKERYDLFGKLHKELEATARKLADEKVELGEGVTFKAGARVPQFKGEGITPDVIHERLSEIVPDYQADKITFYNECGDVSPTRVRAAMAKRLGVKENDVVEKMTELLGERNLLEINRRAPTVVVSEDLKERAFESESSEEEGFKVTA